MSVIDLDQLKKFCSTDEDRPMLSEPWTRGAWTAATDGAICVRVPAFNQIPDREEAPDTTQLFVQAKNNYSRALFHPLPQLPEPQRTLCFTCAGLRGVRRLPNFEPDYLFEGDDPEDALVPATLNCADGAFPCPSCDGAGKIDKPQYVDVGPRRFNVKYLHLIADLPLVSAAFFNDQTSDSEPLHFLFAGGGEGLLMPVRKDTSTDALVVRVIQPPCQQNQNESSLLPR